MKDYRNRGRLIGTRKLLAILARLANDILAKCQADINPAANSNGAQRGKMNRLEWFDLREAVARITKWGMNPQDAHALLASAVRDGFIQTRVAACALDKQFIGSAFGGPLLFTANHISDKELNAADVYTWSNSIRGQKNFKGERLPQYE